MLCVLLLYCLQYGILLILCTDRRNHQRDAFDDFILHMHTEHPAHHATGPLRVRGCPPVISQQDDFLSACYVAVNMIPYEPTGESIRQMSRMTLELKEKTAALDSQEASIGSLRSSEANLSQQVIEQRKYIQELQAKLIASLREVRETPSDILLHTP